MIAQNSIVKIKNDKSETEWIVDQIRKDFVVLVHTKTGEYRTSKRENLVVHTSGFLKC